MDRRRFAEDRSHVEIRDISSTVPQWTLPRDFIQLSSTTEHIVQKAYRACDFSYRHPHMTTFLILRFRAFHSTHRFCIWMKAAYRQVEDDHTCQEVSYNKMQQESSRGCSCSDESVQDRVVVDRKTRTYCHGESDPIGGARRPSNQCFGKRT